MKFGQNEPALIHGKHLKWQAWMTEKYWLPFYFLLQIGKTCYVLALNWKKLKHIETKTFICLMHIRLCLWRVQLQNEPHAEQVTFLKAWLISLFVVVMSNSTLPMPADRQVLWHLPVPVFRASQKRMDDKRRQQAQSGHPILRLSQVTSTGSRKCASCTNDIKKRLKIIKELQCVVPKEVSKVTCCHKASWKCQLLKVHKK